MTQPAGRAAYCQSKARYSWTLYELMGHGVNLNRWFARQSPGLRGVGLGGGEGLLDDERLAAAHRVARDDPEVVGRVLAQAADLDHAQRARPHLLP